VTASECDCDSESGGQWPWLASSSVGVLVTLAGGADTEMHAVTHHIQQASQELNKPYGYMGVEAMIFKPT
jgi:hypothetical protein